MTDNEIIKALECCQSNADCANCPYYENNHHQCGDNFNKDALDLINRQQAEIDRLTYKLECLLCHATGSKLSKSTYSLRTMVIAVNDEVQKCCVEAQSEAIKEFAERLKKYAKAYCIPGIVASSAVDVHCIDNLVAEMVGDNNAG